MKEPINVLRGIDGFTIYLCIHDNISPVNSSSSGKTIIKFKDIEVEENEYSYLLKETIKTIKVKITIRPFNKKETPFVSNIKLCMGKNTGNIYV